MKRMIALAFVATIGLLPACRENPSGLIVGAGSISASLAECSSWYLHADSGVWYELTGLEARFQQPGLRVRFTLRQRDDLASVCMTGPKADVLSMTKY